VDSRTCRLFFDPMSDHDHLPELPLMLAGVPRSVAESLRTAGPPVEDMPCIPLSAAGVGRFVLFDSRNSRSTGLARRAARAGLILLDLHELCDGADWQELEKSGAVAALSQATRLLIGRLKDEIERLGGLWIRLGELPHPFRSALGA